MVPKHVVSAGVVVLNEKDEILLIRGPRRGWEQPGGIVEQGETIRDAAIREVKEETGIEVEIVRFCGVYQNLKSGSIITCWLGKAVGGEIQTSSESIEVGFFKLEDAYQMIKWSNFSERIKKSLDETQQPFFVDFYPG